MKTRYEYVIWGIPKGKKEEVILLTQLDGRNITDITSAHNLSKYISSKYRCKKLRVQKIDLGKNDISEDFINSIN